MALPESVGSARKGKARALETPGLWPCGSLWANHPARHDLSTTLIPCGSMISHPSCRGLNKRTGTKKPHGVTHSQRCRKDRAKPGTVQMPKALLRSSQAGKGQGAASRKKWWRGVETGNSIRCSHRKATEYARFGAPLAEGVAVPDTAAAEKGYLWEIDNG